MYMQTTGRDPDKLLSLRSKYDRVDSLPIAVGIVPIRLYPLHEMELIYVASPMQVGIVLALYA